MSVRRILQKQGLRIFKVEKLFTHGGSLRVPFVVTQTIPGKLVGQ